jgi:hypothetical protein
LKSSISKADTSGRNRYTPGTLRADRENDKMIFFHSLVSKKDTPLDPMEAP